MILIPDLLENQGTGKQQMLLLRKVLTEFRQCNVKYLCFVTIYI